MDTAYLTFRLSWELYQQAPENLDEQANKRLRHVAQKQWEIEQRILSSPEALQVMVPETTRENRLAEIRQRYPDSEAFLKDLQQLGLDENQFSHAVDRDLRVESVLEKIAADVTPCTTIDAEIYYRLHPEGFDQPEARKLRHILITYDSPREKAKALNTLEGLRGRLHTVDEFGQAALKYSQCPTAMEGGILGTVQRGKLFPELEPTAFSLSEGEVSLATESPIGLHLLLCEEILPSGLIPFERIQSTLIEKLTEKRRKDAQRQWIKGLF